MHKITQEEYAAFRKYILAISGISLDEGKEYLVEARLRSLMAELKCSSFSELHNKSRTDPTKSIERKIIDAISTNETYFFRDVAPFDLLQHKIIPDLIDSRTDRGNPNAPVPVRIWSAASSTGQEVYSIAIVLKELYLDPRKYQVKLLGTDISGNAIARASYGRYNKFEMSRGLSPSKVKRYFDPDGDFWRIKDEIRAMVMFKKINLMDPLVGIGKFDIILCRNVAIYFSPENRKRLYDKLAGVLEPDGYLMVGATESLIQDTPLFEPHRYLRAVFYQLKR